MSSFMPVSQFSDGYNDLLLMLMIALIVLGLVCLSWVALLFVFVSNAPWKEPEGKFGTDLRRFGRFLDSLALEDIQALLSTMNRYDRDTLRSAIGVLQAAVGCEVRIASKSPSRLYDVTSSNGIVEAAKLMDTETSVVARRLSSNHMLLEAAQEQLKLKSHSDVGLLESSVEEEPELRKSTSEEEMTNSVAELLCLPEMMRSRTPRHSPFFHTSYDAIQAATLCTAGVTTPKVPILMLRPPGPSMTPPGRTPPAVRPPARTPPLMSPPAMSPHTPTVRPRAPR
mmetsp:Transcript_110830/g.195824  ORF Transcript_110830/g.195824 Transcript_110830/m.195824 type:complete len:283 (-) Transcript_110830:57-905(-)